MSEYIILFFEENKLFTCYVKAENIEEARRAFETICDGEITHIQATNYDEWNYGKFLHIIGLN